MNPENVVAAMGMQSDAGWIMARVVCSTYRPEKFLFGLGSLSHLDDRNYQIAMSVIGYRRTPAWSDDVFSALFLQAKQRLGVTS